MNYCNASTEFNYGIHLDSGQKDFYLTDRQRLF
jgi:hypothetical protein